MPPETVEWCNDGIMPLLLGGKLVSVRYQFLIKKKKKITNKISILRLNYDDIYMYFQFHENLSCVRFSKIQNLICK